MLKLNFAQVPIMDLTVHLASQVFNYIIILFYFSLIINYH